MTERKQKANVLIIGSGLMGAAVAHVIGRAAPRATISMVDAGPLIGSRPGLHVHDTPDEEIWLRYNRQPSPGIQPPYSGPNLNAKRAEAVTDLQPGMHTLAAIGEDARELPGAGISWNTGGMGVHWTGATPTPWGSEVPVGIPAKEWAHDVSVAQNLLRVSQDPFGPSNLANALRRALASANLGEPTFAGREVQSMPMALFENDRGFLGRVGPSIIFPEMTNRSDGRYSIFPSTLATRLNHDGKIVNGADLLSIQTGETWSLESSVTVICADSIRTPQLLFASGIDGSAIGRFLNEHAFLSGRVLVDPRSIGSSYEDIPAIRDKEWCLGSHWIPHQEQVQPFHGQITDTIFQERDGSLLAYSVGLSFYVPTEIREDNRLIFSDFETDLLGMPRITVRYSYSERDRSRIEQAREVQRKTAERLGDFDPRTESILLRPGSSFHITGTVRMGQDDDGSCVCDTDMKVWNYENLFLAGCGVIPTAMACNATLTGIATAVRAARSASAALSRR